MCVRVCVCVYVFEEEGVVCVHVFEEEGVVCVCVFEELEGCVCKCVCLKRWGVV